MTGGYGSPASAQNNFGEIYLIKKTSYSYDAAGNKLSETYTIEKGGWYDNGYYDQYWVSNWEYSSSIATYQNGSASYDALGRMTNWSESGNDTTPAASIAYSYDANGNVRRSNATYYILDQVGAASTQSSQDYWYPSRPPGHQDPECQNGASCRCKNNGHGVILYGSPGGPRTFAPCNAKRKWRRRIVPPRRHIV